MLYTAAAPTFSEAKHSELGISEQSTYLVKSGGINNSERAVQRILSSDTYIICLLLLVHTYNVMYISLDLVNCMRNLAENRPVTVLYSIHEGPSSKKEGSL